MRSLLLRRASVLMWLLAAPAVSSAQDGNAKGFSVEQLRQTLAPVAPYSDSLLYVPAYNPTVVYGTWRYPSYPP